MLAPPRTAAGDDQVKAKARRKGHELGGRTLIVGNLAIVEAMDLPPHIERANFNAVAGRDRWKDVRLLVIVGRPMPRPQDVERMAGALTGLSPETIGERWYPKAAACRMKRKNGQ